jgi:hypothetical protein
MGTIALEDSAIDNTVDRLFRVNRRAFTDPALLEAHPEPGLVWPTVAWLGLILLSVALLGAGCAHYEPFEPTPIDDIPDGPGLLTGTTGKWSLVGKGRLLPKSDSADAQEATPPQVSPAAPPSPAPERPVPGEVKPKPEQRKKTSVPL